jgi:hypothetical protein
VSSDYGIVTLEVDGVEAATIDLSNYQSDEMVSLDLSATTPTSTTGTGGTTTPHSSGGGGGFSSSSATTSETVVEEPDADVDTESTLESTTESTIAEETASEVTEDVTEGFSSVSGTGGMIAIFGLILMGIVIVGYRSKKK